MGYRPRSATMLLTKELRSRLPSLDADLSSNGEAIAHAKFFYPDFSWTWYAVAFDGEDSFYGLIDGVEPEIGYFSLNELLTNRGKFGCAIERDRSFKPTPISKLKLRAARS